MVGKIVVFVLTGYCLLEIIGGIGAFFHCRREKIDFVKWWVRFPFIGNWDELPIPPMIAWPIRIVELLVIILGCIGLYNANTSKGYIVMSSFEIDSTKDTKGVLDEASKYVYPEDEFMLTMKCDVKKRNFLGNDNIKCLLYLDDTDVIDMDESDSPVLINRFSNNGSGKGFEFLVPVSNNGGEQISVMFRCKAKSAGEKVIKGVFVPKLFVKSGKTKLIEGNSEDQFMYTITVKEL